VEKIIKEIRKKEFTKNIISKAKLFKKCLDLKSHRIAVFHYVLCKVEYCIATELALDWLSIKEAEKIVIKELKIGMKIGNNIPNNFVKTLYRWNIKETMIYVEKLTPLIII